MAAHSRIRRLLPLVALLTVACHSGDDARQVGAATDDDELVQSAVDLVTDEAGRVTVEIEVQNHRSFLVTAESGTNTALTALVSPSGEVVVDGAHWYEQPYWYSEAIVGGTVDATFNWPVRGADGPLENGTYQATFEVYDDAYEYLTGHPVAATIHRNLDDDVTTGHLRVLVVWADGIDENPVAVQGTEKAVARWEEIWSQAGIGFEVSYASSDIDPDLGSPGEGDALSRAGELGDGRQMIVLVGDLVAGGGTLGEAGGIPGPLVATDHTGMVLGWLDSAGTDGVFADEEIEVFAETMAHEMGHYLGLFHAFEQADVETDVVSAWDALDDTPTCSTGVECEALFATNVMVPYTVYDDEGMPVVADQLTPMQSQQMQHYTGILAPPAGSASPADASSPADGSAPGSAADDSEAAPSGSFERALSSASPADRDPILHARRLLSSRHAAVACPLDVEPSTYRTLIDQAGSPVAMRAAGCLIDQQGDAAVEDLRHWLVSERRGLRRLARHRLDRLSPAVAAPLRELAAR